jgi:hypothetical protein
MIPEAVNVQKNALKEITTVQNEIQIMNYVMNVLIIITKTKTVVVPTQTTVKYLIKETA